MSIYPHARGIHTLNLDILLHIFTLKANMFPYEGRKCNALPTTRITSQVCQNWRNLMLATPSLWARLIDMDCLSDPWNIEWTEELIRRSGAALLWIRAESCCLDEDEDEDKVVANFFLEIIDQNWHRIQKLVVQEQSYDFTFDVIQMAYEFPAPHLETFNVSLFDYTNFDYNNSAAPFPSLFGGHAPMLRRFRLDNYTLDQRAPWLCQLHSLVLDGEYNVRDILTVLMETHSLQELEINLEASGDTPQSSPRFPIVSFPHLKSLDFTGQSDSCITLLDHIEIPLRCSISKDFRFEETDEQYLSAVDAFNRHARRFLKSNVFQTVSLTYMPSGIPSSARMDTSPVESQYCITITLDDKHALFAAILNRLTHLDLSGTTTLRLSSNGPLDPSFFGRLSSLDTICVNELTLRHLVVLQDNMNATEKPHILFPSLRVLDLVIDHSFYRSHPTTDHVEVAGKFILPRTRNGYPIATLDMRRYSSFDPAPNLDALEEVKGLKVLYRLSKMSGIFEHICGSGEPAKHIVTI